MQRKATPGSFWGQNVSLVTSLMRALDQCAALHAALLEKAGIRWIQDSICGLEVANTAVNGENSGKIANEIHVVTDAATSVLAIAALAGGWLYGWAWLDPADRYSESKLTPVLP